MKKYKILVTGGTGFLGRHVVPLLRSWADVSVLSRSEGSEIKGDLNKWNAGLDLEKLKEKSGGQKFDLFLHMAGLYDLKASELEVYKHNVQATNMALKISDLLEIPYFVNTSSVAAAINSPLSIVRPYDLNVTRPFPDPYSQSKAFGEQMIHAWPGQHRLKMNLRLGILVGNTKNGEILRIDGPYHAAVAVDKAKSLLESLPTSIPLPGSRHVRFPLVPVDSTALAISRMLQWVFETDPSGYLSYHLTPKEGLSVLDFYKSTLKHRFVRHKGVKLISYVPQSLLTKLAQISLKFPEEQLKYVFKLPKFESEETTKILGDWCPEFKDYEKIYWRGYEKFISNSRN